MLRHDDCDEQRRRHSMCCANVARQVSGRILALRDRQDLRSSCSFHCAMAWLRDGRVRAAALRAAPCLALLLLLGTVIVNCERFEASYCDAVQLVLWQL